MAAHVHSKQSGAEFEFAWPASDFPSVAQTVGVSGAGRVSSNAEKVCGS
jgi:hypothetical protein